MPMRTWFSSDAHLFHHNIIRYCNRPFSSIEEMNAAIVERWNARVGPKDDVYVLGDFILTKDTRRASQIVGNFTGHIHLIRGNHDKDKIVDAIAWRLSTVSLYKEIKIEKQKIVLCHYPMLTWNGSHRGTWDLYGHSHGTIPTAVNQYAKRLDVGVDCHDYAPIEFEEIKAILDKREFRPTDYHGTKRGE